MHSHHTGKSVLFPQTPKPAPAQQLELLLALEVSCSCIMPPTLQFPEWFLCQGPGLCALFS